MVEKIHAVWLGDRMPPLAHACIDDWSKQGYKFRLWTDRDNIVQEWIRSCSFAAACYKRKLFAFVSDYLRLKILEHEGGLYLDTDVTIRKNPFPLFKDVSFSAGYETDQFIGTASIYARKDSLVLQKAIAFYEKDIWRSPLYIGPQILTHLLIDEGYSDLESCTLYPVDYFYNYQQEPMTFEASEDSYLIHWFQHSWKQSNGLLFLKTKHLGFWKSIYVWQKYFFRGRL